MIYILVNKNSNRVMQISNKKFNSYSDNLLLVEVETLPEKYDYLEADSIREVTDTWTETQEDYDDNGEIVAKEVVSSRTYLTCDLVAKFKNEKVLSDTVKEKIRNEKIVKLIRKKYTLDEELSILRQKDSKPDKFNDYFSYANECVNSVPKQ